jgi:hypothetical protein
MCQRHTLGRPWGAQHWPCISLENKLRTVQVGVIPLVRTWAKKKKWKKKKVQY